jgi:hypothetical protein
MIDPENVIVRLCAEGMTAEVQGRADDARRLFAEAWARRRDDYEASIAAHYVARHQPTEARTLLWNARAARHAEAADADRTRELLASLYLNLGHSYEVVGRHTEARSYATRAAAALSFLPDGGYREFTRRGIEALCERLAMPACV